MKYTNDFVGKTRLVRDLSNVYQEIEYADIVHIGLFKYRKKGTQHEEELIVLVRGNGAISTANNNANSLSATARNVARMLDGGVYENLDFYKKIMKSEEWERVYG